jgi:hypothetical protein
LDFGPLGPHLAYPPRYLSPTPCNSGFRAKTCVKIGGKIRGGVCTYYCLDFAENGQNMEFAMEVEGVSRRICISD